MVCELCSSLMLKREEDTFLVHTLGDWQKSMNALEVAKYQKIASQYAINKQNISEILQFYALDHGKSIPFSCHQYYAAHS